MAIFYVAKCSVIPGPIPRLLGQHPRWQQVWAGRGAELPASEQLWDAPRAGSWEKSAMGWYPWWCMNRNRLKNLLYIYYTQHLYNIKKWLHGMRVILVKFNSSWWSLDQLRYIPSATNRNESLDEAVLAIACDKWFVASPCLSPGIFQKWGPIKHHF